jgi:hypothetical protein
MVLVPFTMSRTNVDDLIGPRHRGSCLGNAAVVQIDANDGVRLREDEAEPREVVGYSAASGLLERAPRLRIGRGGILARRWVDGNFREFAVAFFFRPTDPLVLGAE